MFDVPFENRRSLISINYKDAFIRLNKIVGGMRLIILLSPIRITQARVNECP